MSKVITMVERQQLGQRRLDHYNKWLMDNTREFGVAYPGYPEEETELEQPKPVKVTKTVKPVKSKGSTKKVQATKIFARVGGLKNPAIMAFITELDMTRAGATTYFYAIKAGK